MSPTNPTARVTVFERGDGWINTHIQAVSLLPISLWEPPRPKSHGEKNERAADLLKLLSLGARRQSQTELSFFLLSVLLCSIANAKTTVVRTVLRALESPTNGTGGFFSSYFSTLGSNECQLSHTAHSVCQKCRARQTFLLLFLAHRLQTAVD